MGYARAEKQQETSVNLAPRRPNRVQPHGDNASAELALSGLDFDFSRIPTRSPNEYDSRRPGDKQEREADQAAERVMRMGEPSARWERAQPQSADSEGSA